MPDKEIYEYAIIRVVPKVEREEFLNVGVILLSQRKKFLGMKVHLDEQRLKCFSDDMELETLKQYLDAWELVCQGKEEGGAIGLLNLHLRFRWLTATRSTIIQSSKVHPGRCANPELVLEQLFERYVL